MINVRRFTSGMAVLALCVAYQGQGWAGEHPEHQTAAPAQSAVSPAAVPDMTCFNFPISVSFRCL